MGQCSSFLCCTRLEEPFIRLEEDRGQYNEATNSEKLTLLKRASLSIVGVFEGFINAYMKQTALKAENNPRLQELFSAFAPFKNIPIEAVRGTEKDLLAYIEDLQNKVESNEKNMPGIPEILEKYDSIVQFHMKNAVNDLRNQLKEDSFFNSLTKAQEIITSVADVAAVTIVNHYREFFVFALKYPKEYLEVFDNLHPANKSSDQTQHQKLLSAYQRIANGNSSKTTKMIASTSSKNSKSFVAQLKKEMAPIKDAYTDIIFKQRLLQRDLQKETDKQEDLNDVATKLEIDLVD